MGVEPVVYAASPDLVDYSPSPRVDDDNSLRRMQLTRVFAEALRYHRELAGLSQEQLAGRSKLDRTYVSQLERALKSPTLNSVESLSLCLGVHPRRLLTSPPGSSSTVVPRDYIVRSSSSIVVDRPGASARVSMSLLIGAINAAHDLIDELYATNLDIARTLGMRNLSAFVGELVAAAVVNGADGLFRANPHQDGYPDLLLMDQTGKKEWNRLHERLNEKSPFSPFAGGGIEIKATCGSVPSPKVCVSRGMSRPDLGDTRIGLLSGYDWKAHHRDTNNLAGILWDFIGGRPRIVALFYCSNLTTNDWGRIVQPRAGGGRTTSVSIMEKSGIKKMYEGWLCVLASGGYVEFLNRRNRGNLMA